MLFFDLEDSTERSDDKSKVNTTEADFTSCLVQIMASLSDSKKGLHSLSGSIGVITPYKA